MNTRNAWIVYSLLRLAFFAVPFAALMLLLAPLGFAQWTTALISGIVAALIAVSLSVIFLAKPREAAAESIYEWRNRSRTADDVVEDDAVDAQLVTEVPTAEHATTETNLAGEATLITGDGDAAEAGPTPPPANTREVE